MEISVSLTGAAELFRGLHGCLFVREELREQARAEACETWEKARQENAQVHAVEIENFATLMVLMERSRVGADRISDLIQHEPDRLRRLAPDIGTLLARIRDGSIVSASVEIDRAREPLPKERHPDS